jgi:hypothetical protein
MTSSRFGDLARDYSRRRGGATWKADDDVEELLRRLLDDESDG